MKLQNIQILSNHLLEKDFSVEKQTECLELSKLILKVNQYVKQSGLGIIDSYIGNINNPILERGLLLVRKGFIPEDIEEILINMIIINKIDFLTSIIILHGISAIQTHQEPYITKEFLRSCFTLEFQSVFEKELNEMILEINDVHILSIDEVNNLIIK